MEVLIYIITALLCYWIAGLIHETGHIIVGLICGWKFNLLVIGPLGLKVNETGKPQFYVEKRLVLWGGVGGTMPQKADDKNSEIWGKILLGGPLASILTGVFFLPLGIIEKNMMLLLLGAMSLGMGIMCALPFPIKTGITYSDGMRWSRLHKKGQEADEEIAMFKLMENEITGNDISALDPRQMESLIKSKEAEFRYYGYYYFYQYHKSEKNETEMKAALQAMEELKNKVSTLIKEDRKITATR